MGSDQNDLTSNAKKKFKDQRSVTDPHGMVVDILSLGVRPLLAQPAHVEVRVLHSHPLALIDDDSFERFPISILDFRRFCAAPFFMYDVTDVSD